MNARDILTMLKKLGKPQTAAIYKRFGSGENVFGTLTSEVGKLQKKIKIDDALAAELWETGNAEARILALLISDPAKLTRSRAEELLKDDQAHFLGFYLSALVARSPIASKAMRAWMKSWKDLQREIGYGVLSARLKNDPDSIGDADADELLTVIEAEIRRSPNWARHAMNNALISIGVHKPALRGKAIEAARRIGKVEVDYGETNCKTPDAMRKLAVVDVD